MFEINQTLLKYSKTELVENVRDLKHPLAREILMEFELSGLDISVSSDIPSGTGLGSSSAFTVGLINLLAEYKGLSITQKSLAEKACDIEIEKLREPIGKQDQYASAFGGLNIFQFEMNGNVNVKKINLSEDHYHILNNSLFLVRTGVLQRSAGAELLKQKQLAEVNPNIELRLCELRDFTFYAANEFIQNPNSLGKLLNESWRLKVASNPAGVNGDILELIEKGIASGATGAKLLGAGAGGFVLFVINPKSSAEFLNKMSPLTCHKIEIDEKGSEIIYKSA